MNNSPETSFSALAASRLSSPLKMIFRTGLVLGLLLALGGQRVQAQDDDYLAIYGVIDQADALNASGKTVQAHNKYVEAKREMMTFQQTYPSWNTATVRFRLKYLDDKIAATMPSAVPAAAPSPVKLIDAGSEPKKVLRLHPAVGDKQSINMNMKMAMEMSMGGNKLPPQKIPAMQMSMDTTVKTISKDGEISYDLVFGDATVSADTNTPAEMVGALKTALAGISGITGTGQISGQGFIKDMKLNVPADANPQLSQMLDQMKDSFSSSAIALPNVAVGAGAKWEYTTKLKTQGMTINLTSDFELVSIDGDVLTLHVTVKESAANQVIQSPATQGMKVNLNQLTATATGTDTLDLGHIMPTSATVESESATSIGAGQ